jgi:tRNA(fMet)-specific endonuclease VapC
MALILDTNFVIAAEREARRGDAERAYAFLSSHANEEFFITFTVAGELACGTSASAMIAWQKLIHPFALLGWVREISFLYGEIYRQLAAKGSLIGTNDLWIAATARHHGIPVVTNNFDEFSRVEDLKVLRF